MKYRKTVELLIFNLQLATLLNSLVLTAFFLLSFSGYSGGKLYYFITFDKFAFSFPIFLSHYIVFLFNCVAGISWTVLHNLCDHRLVSLFQTLIGISGGLHHEAWYCSIILSYASYMLKKSLSNPIFKSSIENRSWILLNTSWVSLLMPFLSWIMVIYILISKHSFLPGTNPILSL